MLGDPSRALRYLGNLGIGSGDARVASRLYRSPSLEAANCFDVPARPREREQQIMSSKRQTKRGGGQKMRSLMAQACFRHAQL